MVLEKKKRLIFFWIIMGLIVFARAFLFGKVPGGINQDEAFSGYNAYTLLKFGKDSYGYSFPMYLMTWGSGMNALSSYLMIPVVAIFGLHTWSIRLVPCVLAILALVAVYKMIRENVKDDVLALFTMFFCGVAPWHIMLSRWALESNLAPAFLVFGMYFFLKGLKNEKYYIVSALIYGLSLYSYATVWTVVPVIVFLLVLYAILTKRMKFSKYTIISFVVLFLTALPAMLFILVNKGTINEIRTPLLSIPKMVVFRGGEVSLKNIPGNFKNLKNILTTQNDGLIWNSTEKFGIFYKFSLPFFFIGLAAVIAPLFLRFKKKEAVKAKEESKKANNEGDFFFCTMVLLLAGFLVGILVNVNINRVNIIFMPILIITAYGWYSAFSNRKFKGIRLDIIPVILYLVCFISFEMFYFTEYRNDIGGCFREGLGDCFEVLEKECKDAEKVYVTHDIYYPRVLFYVEENLNEYLDTVEYTNFPSAYLDVSSFGKYVLDVNTEAFPEEGAVYVVNSGSADSYLVQMLEQMGYNMYESKGYRIYYP
ncbi:MAG: glycosyltransferase family 39 protein [Lachnospiraceae bacterium]|nr:glycosyltransferase family 39 protein [Lachnospiraceae bacterium]